MTALLAVVVSVVALAVVIVLGATTVRILRVPQAVSEELGGLTVREIHARLDAVEVACKSLPSLWEHERQVALDAKDHATKQRRAAAQALSDLERRGAQGGDRVDSDDVDEAAELLAQHAGGGDPQGVLPMHPDVARDSQEDLRERALAVGVGPFI